jgi:hypothetical protein
MMAVVLLSGDLLTCAGGVDTLTIDAPRVIDLRHALARRFPGIEALIEPLAVAIDGDIHNDADYVALRADSEVHFVPRIAGG